MSVLLENIPVVKFPKKLHQGPKWFIFHNLTQDYIEDVTFLNVFQQNTCISIIKRALHDGLKKWILFSPAKNNILLTCCAPSQYIVLPLENKIHTLISPFYFTNLHFRAIKLSVIDGIHGIQGSDTIRKTAWSWVKIGAYDTKQIVNQLEQ